MANPSVSRGNRFLSTHVTSVERSLETMQGVLTRYELLRRDGIANRLMGGASELFGGEWGSFEQIRALLQNLWQQLDHTKQLVRQGRLDDATAAMLSLMNQRRLFADRLDEFLDDVYGGAQGIQIGIGLMPVAAGGGGGCILYPAGAGLVGGSLGLHAVGAAAMVYGGTPPGSNSDAELASQQTSLPLPPPTPTPQHPLRREPLPQSGSQQRTDTSSPAANANAAIENHSRQWGAYRAQLRYQESLIQQLMRSAQNEPARVRSLNDLATAAVPLRTSWFETGAPSSDWISFALEVEAATSTPLPRQGAYNQWQQAWLQRLQAARQAMGSLPQETTQEQRLQRVLSALRTPPALTPQQRRQRPATPPAPRFNARAPLSECVLGHATNAACETQMTMAALAALGMAPVPRTRFALRVESLSPSVPPSNSEPVVWQMPTGITTSLLASSWNRTQAPATAYHPALLAHQALQTLIARGATSVPAPQPQDLNVLRLQVVPLPELAAQDVDRATASLPQQIHGPLAETEELMQELETSSASDATANAANSPASRALRPQRPRLSPEAVIASIQHEAAGNPEATASASASASAATASQPPRTLTPEEVIASVQGMARLGDQFTVSRLLALLPQFNHISGAQINQAMELMQRLPSSQVEQALNQINSLPPERIDQALEALRGLPNEQIAPATALIRQVPRAQLPQALAALRQLALLPGPQVSQAMSLLRRVPAPQMPQALTTLGQMRREDLMRALDATAALPPALALAALGQIAANAPAHDLDHLSNEDEQALARRNAARSVWRDYPETFETAGDFFQFWGFPCVRSADQLCMSGVNSSMYPAAQFVTSSDRNEQARRYSYTSAQLQQLSATANVFEPRLPQPIFSARLQRLLDSQLDEIRNRTVAPETQRLWSAPFAMAAQGFRSECKEAYNAALRVILFQSTFMDQAPSGPPLARHPFLVAALDGLFPPGSLSENDRRALATDMSFSCGIDSSSLNDPTPYAIRSYHTSFNSNATDQICDHDRRMEEIRFSYRAEAINRLFPENGSTLTAFEAAGAGAIQNIRQALATADPHQRQVNFVNALGPLVEIQLRQTLEGEHGREANGNQQATPPTAEEVMRALRFERPFSNGMLHNALASATGNRCLIGDCPQGCDIPGINLQTTDYTHLFQFNLTAVCEALKNLPSVRRLRGAVARYRQEVQERPGPVLAMVTDFRGPTTSSAARDPAPWRTHLRDFLSLTEAQTANRFSTSSQPSPNRRILEPLLALLGDPRRVRIRQRPRRGAEPQPEVRAVANTELPALPTVVEVEYIAPPTSEQERGTGAGSGTGAGPAATGAGSGTGPAATAVPVPVPPSTPLPHPPTAGIVGQATGTRQGQVPSPRHITIPLSQFLDMLLEFSRYTNNDALLRQRWTPELAAQLPRQNIEANNLLYHMNTLVDLNPGPITGPFGRGISRNLAQTIYRALVSMSLNVNLLASIECLGVDRDVNINCFHAGELLIFINTLNREFGPPNVGLPSQSH